jgi:serine/threonine-protein kinase RsbW
MRRVEYMHEVGVIPAIDLALKNDSLAVRTVLEDLNSQLGTLGFLEDTVQNVELVMAEVLNNVVEHAYPEGEVGDIAISAVPSARGIQFLVQDKGVAMPNGTPPSGEQGSLECELDDLPEGGFGWYLIRVMAQNLEYRRVEGYNQLSFFMAQEVA